MEVREEDPDKLCPISLFLCISENLVQKKREGKGERGSTHTFFSRVVPKGVTTRLV